MNRDQITITTTDRGIYDVDCGGVLYRVVRDGGTIDDWAVTRLDHSETLVGFASWWDRAIDMILEAS